MTDRKRYDFTPDYRHIVNAAWNRPAERLPIYEQHFDSGIAEKLTGLTPHALAFSKDMKESREGMRQFWQFYRELGFDVCCLDFFPGPEVFEGCGALGGHVDGCIKDRDDFERYPWDAVPQRFFDHYGPYIRNFAEMRQPGMMAIGGAGRGPFEAVQDLVGYVDLCYIRADDEELYRDLFKTMGDVLVKIWERFMAEYRDAFCIMRFCDDMGIKHQTLLPPDDLRELVIPTYRRITDIVHSYGRPFILHSCGNVNAIMDDLIDVAKIDGKHSNEDIIAPFADVVHEYGHRIGNFGGIDVGVMTSESPEIIRKMTLECLEAVQGYGGVAISSGSSVPDYVPPENYFAMNEAVRDWRGDRRV